MKFDWSNFTEEDFNNMLTNSKNDYYGAVHVGDICIELLVDSGTSINMGHNHDKFVICNFYVAHEDTGYGYKDDVLPYDYAEGFDVELSCDEHYDKFKEDMETMFMAYINAYRGNYSLVEHANRPLEMW